MLPGNFGTLDVGHAQVSPPVRSSGWRDAVLCHSGQGEPGEYLVPPGAGLIRNLGLLERLHLPSQ
ncbi:MAG: hypothetical protein WHT07_01795 [Desulfobaccales bacterium]